jgi:ATP-dependent exoDNAse (exonuclease V) alpha subunit
MIEIPRLSIIISSKFALTIHKVQGLSLPSITLALNSNIFSDGQAYVGLSRATTIERVFLSALGFDAIKANLEAIEEYERLETKARELEM